MILGIYCLFHLHQKKERDLFSDSIPSPEKKGLETILQEVEREEKQKLSKRRLL